MGVIGRSMPEYFEEFLRLRLSDISLPLQKQLESSGEKTLSSLDIIGSLEKAGLDRDKAEEFDELIVGVAWQEEKAAYSQGVKDGFNLALHLLGMAPENRKEASQ